MILGRSIRALLGVVVVGVAMAAFVASALADGALDPSFSGDGRLSRISSGWKEGIDLAADSHDRIVVVGTVVYIVNGHWELPPIAVTLRYLPDGSLDPGFSLDGVDESSFPGHYMHAEAVAIDQSGRIVVSGGSTLVRYLDDGTLDKSFGAEGVATVPTPPGLYSSYARDLALDAHDRAVVTAGPPFSCLEWGSPESFGVARLTSDGKADSSFGGDGLQVLSFPGYSEVGVEAVAVDSAGRVVVGADVRNGADTDFVVARFLPDGALDPSFGIDGRAILDFGLTVKEDPFTTTPQERLNDLAIDGSGRILVAGKAVVSGEPVSAVGRLLPDGSPDPTFGENGKMTFALPYPSEADEVIVDRAGRPVIAGRVSASSYASPCGFTGKAYVARLTPAGALDPSLGADGIVTEDFAQPHVTGSALTVDAQGRYLLGGTVSSESGQGFGLARYLVDYPQLPAPPLQCRGNDATAVGTGGHDVLVGTHRRDVIVALGGDDTIRSGGGNDVVCAGKGNDVVKAGAGDDRVFGGAGADRLFGQAGRDRLFGESGPDRLNGGAGRDLLRGGPGNDRGR